MVEVHALRVFADSEGRHGNPLGIVIDESDALSPAQRQAIAAELGFSETVFIEDVDTARLRVFTPAIELPLAGHPLVGASWFLTRLTGIDTARLRPALAGGVATWREGEVTWIRAAVADAPGFRFVELATPAEIDALAVPPAPDQDRHEFWAWEDRDAGLVRARVFAGRFGVPEDEATGSAAIILVSRLGRPVTIRQGRGSIIHARPPPTVTPRWAAW